MALVWLFDLLCVVQMQACGQPPQDIVNDLAPGMSFDEDGLPKFGSEAGGGAGCNVQ